MARPMREPRRICFVTGTRAEFGLMRSVLRAIESQASLRLQIVATGMHLDPAHGRTVQQIRREGFSVAATIPWRTAGGRQAFDSPAGSQSRLAIETGKATARLAAAFEKLDPCIVMVVGDRVEAFAAATAAHLSGRIVAHVHGGDRALGQVDDALRHAITKLAHIHFPATRQSAARIRKLGEDPARIHLVGSPGIDGITQEAWPAERYLPLIRPKSITSEESTLGTAHFSFVLLLLHPTSPDECIERDRAGLLLSLVRRLADRVVAIYPNNDPGSAGILHAWNDARDLPGVTFAPDLPRGAFLGLLRDAPLLVGNSSSGIIEAASFGTPVLDIGDRQQGREHGPNVHHCPWSRSALAAVLKRIWNQGRPRRLPARNPYGQGRTGPMIARVLATRPLENLQRKLIAY